MFSTMAMGLPRRLAIIAASLAVGLVLVATEISLSLSERSRLEDLRLEALTISSALADYLNLAAPSGAPDEYEDALADWSGLRLRSTAAALFQVERGGSSRFVAATDSLEERVLSAEDREAIARRQPVAWQEKGERPAWHVAQPLGGTRINGLLTLRLSTARLHEWATEERRRSYVVAFLAALVLAGSVAWLTSRWVGTPLRAVGEAMAGARAGARLGPAAPEIGPPEFRTLARRYNELRSSLADLERESEARGALLALEERARGLERLALVEEASSSFAHEIGTPLSTMNGHFQMLREDLNVLGASEPAHRVELVLGQVERVTGIVRAWLTRSSWPSPEVGSIDLRQAVTRVLEFMEPPLLAANVSTSVEDDPLHPTHARGDSDLLEQILLNLFKNALDAMPEGGELRIGVGKEGAHAWLTVHDSGPGISQEIKDHLFHPFATSKGPSGTGLGLTVSRRLARTLGGDLVLEPGGQGTCWRLTLPLERS